MFESIELCTPLILAVVWPCCLIWLFLCNLSSHSHWYDNSHLWCHILSSHEDLWRLSAVMLITTGVTIVLITVVWILILLYYFWLHVSLGCRCSSILLYLAVVLGTCSLFRNRWELDVRGLVSTKKWLANYGLKRNKLDMKSLMEAVGFKKRDGKL